MLTMASDSQKFYSDSTTTMSTTELAEFSTNNDSNNKIVDLYESILPTARTEEEETLPSTYTSTLVSVVEEEVAIEDKSQEDGEGKLPSSQPAKKMRFDKLGRAISLEDAKPVVPLASDLAAENTGNKLKRPRGRPPKGKIWDDNRGWIHEGLGLGPRRRLF